MKRALPLLLIAVCALAQAPEPSAVQRTIAALEQRLQESPGDATWQYYLAHYYAQAKRNDDALRMLESLLGRGLGLLPDPESFGGLESDPRFKKLKQALEEESPPVARGQVLFRLAQKEHEEIVPEGIAYDAAARRWFLGDMHRKRIYEVQANGSAKVFAELPLIPLGLRVDPKRKLLWAATYAGDFAPAEKKEAALEKLDLRTGKRLARYTAPGAPLFNDVALAANGDVYLTDSERGGVLRLPAGREKLEEVVAPGSLRYPNGIAVSADGKKVFVAQSTSVVVLDTATGKFEPLKRGKDVVAAGIDGLYRDGDSLLGVQNGVTPERIVRLRLNPAQDTIVAVEVLESRNPEFLIPTTAALAGKELHVLANAQLRQLTGEGRIADRKGLREIVVLSVPLR